MNDRLKVSSGMNKTILSMTDGKVNVEELLTQLTAANARAEANLKKYGWHHRSCAARNRAVCAVCTCGFEEALEQTHE